MFSMYEPIHKLISDGNYRIEDWGPYIDYIDKSTIHYLMPTKISIWCVFLVSLTERLITNVSCKI